MKFIGGVVRVVLLAALMSLGAFASSIELRLDNSGNQLDLFNGNGLHSLITQLEFRADDELAVTLAGLQVNLTTTGSVVVKNLVLTSRNADSSGPGSGDGPQLVLGTIPLPGPIGVFVFGLPVEPNGRVTLRVLGDLSGVGTIQGTVPVGGVDGGDQIVSGLPVIGRVREVEVEEADEGGAVPEPGTMFLMGSSLVGLALVMKRRLAA